MATQFLGVMRSSELGSARGVKREGGESSRLDRPRVARLSGKHSLPRIDLRRRRCCVFQVHESRTHSAIHSRRTADNGLAIQRRRDVPASLLFCGDDDGTFFDHVGKQVQRKGLRHLGPRLHLPLSRIER